MPDDSKASIRAVESKEAEEQAQAKVAQKQVAIAHIVANPKTCRVFLSDGSELVGLVRVQSNVGAGDTPMVSIEARIAELGTVVSG